MVQKDWKAQNYYNEYMSLKVEISEMTKNFRFIESTGTVLPQEIEIRKEKINEKIERFKFILHQLKLCGVDLQDLILLSVGVEINLDL